MEYKSNYIRSGLSKPLIIFLSIMFGTSIGMLFACIFVPIELPVKIIGYVLCGVFSIISAIVLIDHLFDYVYVEGDEIVAVVIFKRTHRKIKDIKKIKHIEGYYEIYLNSSGKKPFTTLSDRDPATTKMLFQFEKHGVSLTKIVK